VVRSASLAPVASALGADLSAAQSASAFQVKPLAAAQFHVHARIEPVERNSAPNVVGILEGSDPTLKNEYVVFSAHMDHVGVAGPRGSGGCRAQGADSICNGADDDGSGTVAVVEIAEAFAGMNPRPKRSIIFLNVSGEEKGLWGSEYFSDHPAVPVSSIVADLNIDMIGRNWKDTIVAIGKEHSDLGATLNRVGAAHPELNMRPIDDIWPQENFYFRSDHYNFARKGVPILFFFSGTHADYHQASDSPDKIDAEKESRVAQLIFYLGVDVANGAERPKWNPDSYKRIVSGN
jgi:Zn-dependent M28 family amino/carboxypeptidase